MDEKLIKTNESAKLSGEANQPCWAIWNFGNGSI